MDGQLTEVQVASIREMARKIAAEPMGHLNGMNRDIAHVDLSSGSYGAFSVFGLLGGSLGEAFDEVKKAAQTYLAGKRTSLSQIHDKAYDTANGYVTGDGKAAQVAGQMPATGK